MRRISFIGAIISVTCLLMTAGCDNDYEGPMADPMAIAFSMIIVDENDNNLLDPSYPDNIIDKTHFELERSDGKVIPLHWPPDSITGPRPPYPYGNVDHPLCFVYAARFNCLVIEGWNSEADWETSFKIKIPDFDIELNVTGQNQWNVYKKSSLTSWWVNNSHCRPVLIDSIYKTHVNYKLTLPINNPLP